VTRNVLGETRFIHTEASKAFRRKRVILHRARRRRGVNVFSVLVTAKQLERLQEHGYEFDPADKGEAAEAIETFIGDFLP
jgi:hypothetical protein